MMLWVVLQPGVWVMDTENTLLPKRGKQHLEKFIISKKKTLISMEIFLIRRKRFL